MVGITPVGWNNHVRSSKFNSLFIKMKLLRENVIKQATVPILWFVGILALLGFLIYINST